MQEKRIGDERRMGRRERESGIGSGYIICDFILLYFLFAGSKRYNK